MLYSYTLNFDNPEEPYWFEAIVAGDARSCGPWEVCFPHSMTARNLNDYANNQWTIPDVDGEEIFQNYNGIPVRS